MLKVNLKMDYLMERVGINHYVMNMMEVYNIIIKITNLLNIIKYIRLERRIN